HVYLAAAIAKVALELAQDRRRGVAGEAVAQGRIEAVDRLDQAQARDLVQILGRLAAAGVAVGEAARERHEAGDELLLHGGIARAVVPREQRRLVGQTLLRAGDRSLQHHGTSITGGLACRTASPPTPALPRLRGRIVGRAS